VTAENSRPNCLPRPSNKVHMVGFGCETLIPHKEELLCRVEVSEGLNFSDLRFVELKVVDLTPT
jgi:hypothetical protein